MAQLRINLCNILTALAICLLLGSSIWAAPSRQCQDQDESLNFALSADRGELVFSVCINSSEDTLTLKEVRARLAPSFRELLYVPAPQMTNPLKGLAAMIFDQDLSNVTIVLQVASISSPLADAQNLIVRSGQNSLEVYPGYLLTGMTSEDKLPPDLVHLNVNQPNGFAYSPSELLMASSAFTLGNGSRQAPHNCASPTNLSHFIPAIKTVKLEVFGCQSLAADISGHTIRTTITSMNLTDLLTGQTLTVATPDIESFIDLVISHHNTADRLQIRVPDWQFKLCINLDPGKDLPWLPEVVPLELEKDGGFCPTNGRKPRYGIQRYGNPPELVEVDDASAPEHPNDADSNEFNPDLNCPNIGDSLAASVTKSLVFADIKVNLAGCRIKIDNALVANWRAVQVLEPNQPAKAFFKRPNGDWTDNASGTQTYDHNATDQSFILMMPDQVKLSFRQQNYDDGGPQYCLWSYFQPRTASRPYRDVDVTCL